MLNVSQKSHLIIRSNQTVLVIHHNGQEHRMLTVPPSEHDLELYNFTILHTESCHQLGIVINDKDRDGLMLDGQKLLCHQNDSQELLFNGHYEGHLNTTTHHSLCIITHTEPLVLLTLNVSRGDHTLSHQTSDVTFTVMSECYSLDRYWTISSDPTRVIYSHITYTADEPLHNISHDNVSFTDKQSHLQVNLLDQSSDVHKFKLERDNHRSVINFHQTSSAVWPGTKTTGLSSTVIALITSLASAIFLVIFCIMGFLVAEFVCRRENFTRAKVSPYVY